MRLYLYFMGVLAVVLAAGAHAQAKHVQLTRTYPGQGLHDRDGHYGQPLR